jgi:hypothetical protein
MSVIHTFSSTNGSGLHACTDDPEGRSLPIRHGPWKHVGRVQAGRDLPHGLDRGTIEKAIEANGFQMWRIRKSED